NTHGTQRRPPTAQETREQQTHQPHHPPLPLRLVSNPHDKRQILPPRRRLRTPRPPNPKHVDLTQPPRNPTPPPPSNPLLSTPIFFFLVIIVKEKPHQIHPRRQHSQLPPRPLGASRRRL